jgi:hypothetical protein
MAEIRREKAKSAEKNKKKPEALKSVRLVARCSYQMAYIGMPA